MYRRDFREVLQEQLGDTERPRALPRPGTNSIALLTGMRRGRAPSLAAVGIFTSHRDGATTIRIHTPGGTFRAVLDHGMRAGEPLLVIDLDAVSFLDAAGLEVLADAASLADRRGSRISVRGARPRSSRVPLARSRGSASIPQN